MQQALTLNAFLFLQGHLGHENSQNGFKVDQQNLEDPRPETEPHLNENVNNNQNDRLANEEEDTCKEGRSPSPRQFSSPQASSNLSPTFFNFPFANDEGRNFKDQALNLALEFNGRGSGLHASRPAISLLGTPKTEESEELLPGTSSNEEEVCGDATSPASMAASVQSALAALQAGQISLNQV